MTEAGSCTRGDFARALSLAARILVVVAGRRAWWLWNRFPKRSRPV